VTDPRPKDGPARLAIGFAGLVGTLGVATAAAASHGNDARLLGAASTICLAHAPVLLALGLHGLRSRALLAASLLFTLGLVAFVGDLLVRQAWGQGLFAGAAPLGGMLLIGGWGAIVVAAGTLRR